MSYLILLTFILAPAYVIKFKFLGFPTDILMLWVALVWLVFIAWLVVKKQFADYCNWKISLDRKLLVFISLFFLSGIIALFIKGFDREKLGQFIVEFLQPISLFFVAGFIFQKYPQSKHYLILTTYYLLAAAGVYAIIQYFTLLGLPPAWWGNSVEPKRALSFFVHPNFYALWSAPLLALLIPDMFEGFSIFNFQFSKLWKPVLWLTGAVGLLLSLSRSGWLGLAAAVIVYLFFAADEKIRKIILSAILVIIIIIISFPNLRWRLVLPFYGEKSAISRISLWRDGWHAVEEAPVTGLGLTGFATHYGVLNTDPNLDTHNFPHNIFLDFWTETGLLGLISFVGIAGIYIYRGLKKSGVILRPKISKASTAEESQPIRSFGLRPQDDAIRLGIALFLIAILFQGLVDNPYFKNDLAMVFWIVLALSL